MTGVRELRSYYEAEARQATRGAPSGFRVEWSHDFAELLVAEGRRSVVDFGAGPGTDAGPFLDAGVGYVGIDLAVGNAALCRSRGGAVVVPASMTAPPLRPGSFAAGWSMSALMHLPDDEVPPALEAMAGCLADGAPLFIGAWGGDGTVELDDTQIVGERRSFHLRTVERTSELLGAIGALDSTTVLDVGPPGWNYQGVRVRIATEQLTDSVDARPTNAR